MKKSQTQPFLIRALFISFAITMALFVFASGSFAQSTTDGAIEGIVKDPSGAAVPGAKVTVKNLGTNAEVVAMTDDTGYFRAAKLQPATYSVSIEATGFAHFTVERVVVQVGSVTDVPAKLNMSSAEATVLVSAEIPAINVLSADFAPVVDQTQISNLPINGGRWSDFALLTPGVVNDSNGFGLLSFRGVSTLLNNNTVDGADNNQAFFSEERGRTRAGYSSAKAAVQEFQVNTSNYSAEYGRAAGAVVNTVTKSGGNALHGEVYVYDRDNSLGAVNPFTTVTTQNSNGTFSSKPVKPTDVRKIYGFGVGGRIISDKLFWYFAFDRFDRNFPGTAIPSNPGVFFANPLAANASDSMVPAAYTVDGTTNCFQTNGKSNINTAAFTSGSTAIANGGGIATASQGACTLMANLGLANYATGVSNYTTGLTGLLGEIGSVPRTGKQTIFFPKLDWQINSKNHASFEVNRMRWISPAGIQTQTAVTFGVASFGNDYVRDTWGVAKLYTSLSSTLTNEARFQYGRDFEFEFAQPPSAYELANLIKPTGYTNPLGLAPDVNFFFSLDIGVPTFLQRPAFPDERRTQYADTLSWAHGKHTLKFGMDVAHTNDLSENLRFQYGSFSYSSIANFISDLDSPNHCALTTTGPHNSPCYSGYQQAFGPLGFTFNTNDLAFFAEDSWRVIPRFTLTVALRYEYEMLPGVILPNPLVPQTQSLPSDTNNLGPRIGFAWDMFGNGKTSVRGGYGIYYGRIINSTVYNALTNTGVNGGQFSFSFIASTTGTPTFPQILSTQPKSTSALGVTFFDKNFQAPSVQQTDLTIEREIAHNTVVSMSYLGSFGRSLPDFVDVNTGSPITNISYTVSGGPLGGTTYTTPFYGTTTTVVTDPTGKQLSKVSTTRPNKNFGAMTEIFSGISSNYNALALQFNRRMTNHLQVMANYTWSHSLDFGQNASTFSDTNDLLSPTNIRAEYGNSIFNVPNRVVVSAVAESPWKVSGPLGYLTNDWQLSPIYAAQSGLPFSLQTSGTPSFSTSSVDPVTGDKTTITYNALGGSINGSGGRRGIDVLGRNTFQLKRTINMDMRLSKKLRFGERYSAEFLGEAFNIFNHMNITSANNTGYSINPGPSLGFNSPFGKPTNGNSNFAYTPRQVQAGFRFFF